MSGTREPAQTRLTASSPPRAAAYPRHEYFRRILCDVFGKDVEQGKLPASEMAFIGKMVEDICYNNAKNYFNF